MNPGTRVWTLTTSLAVLAGGELRQVPIGEAGTPTGAPTYKAYNPDGTGEDDFLDIRWDRGGTSYVWASGLTTNEDDVARRLLA